MCEIFRYKLQEPCFFNTLVFGIIIIVTLLLISETITLATIPNDAFSWVAFGLLLLFGAAVFLGNIIVYFAIRSQLTKLAHLGASPKDTESVRGSMIGSNTFEKMRRNVSVTMLIRFYR
jgi:hypothetical protein